MQAGGRRADRKNGTCRASSRYFAPHVYTLNIVCNHHEPLGAAGAHGIAKAAFIHACTAVPQETATNYLHYCSVFTGNPCITALPKEHICAFDCCYHDLRLLAHGSAQTAGPHLHVLSQGRAINLRQDKGRRWHQARAVKVWPAQNAAASTGLVPEP